MNALTDRFDDALEPLGIAAGAFLVLAGLGTIAGTPWSTNPDTVAVAIPGRRRPRDGGPRCGPGLPQLERPPAVDDHESTGGQHRRIAVNGDDSPDATDPLSDDDVREGAVEKPSDGAPGKRETVASVSLRQVRAGDDEERGGATDDDDAPEAVDALVEVSAFVLGRDVVVVLVDGDELHFLIAGEVGEVAVTAGEGHVGPPGVPPSDSSARSTRG